MLPLAEPSTSTSVSSPGFALMKTELEEGRITGGKDEEPTDRPASDTPTDVWSSMAEPSRLPSESVCEERVNVDVGHVASSSRKRTIEQGEDDEGESEVKKCRQLVSHLECPVCMELPRKGPIYGCANGHLVVRRKKYY